MSRIWVWLAVLAMTGAASAQEGTEDPSPPREEAAAPADESAPEVTLTAGTIVVAEPEKTERASKDAVRLDDIEVTADKRIKTQRDLPGSVGAIRGEKLEQMRAQSMSDYLKLVPGVSIADFGSDRQIPVIRGIASQADQNQFTGYTTGVYLEEMPFNDLFLPLSVPDLNPFDLERVEVMKGPQGTLFGASALAGAIRYIVTKPNLSVWQGKLSTTLMQNDEAERPTQVGAAAVNVPIGSAAAVRAVGVARKEAGIYDSVPNGTNTRNDQDVDQLDQYSGRVLARWDATDTLKLSALVFSQDTHQDDDGSARFPDRFERNDNPFPGPTNSSFLGGNFVAANDFTWGTATYIGNLMDKRLDTMGRSEPALPEQLGNQQAVGWYTFINGTITGYAHELRISSPDGGDWDWLAGAAYFSYHEDFFQFTPNPGPSNGGYYTNPPEEPEDVPATDRPVVFLYATIDAEASESAVFGEVTGRLGDHWEATLGARGFETKMDADSLFQGAQITALGGQTESRARIKLSERGINPKASIRYLHNANVQAYILAARGFQFGGVQINPPIANIEAQAEAKGFHFGPYKSSELWNYELGLRTEWLDRRLRLDFAAFYLDWTDLQLTIQVPVNPVPVPAPPGSGIPENVNLDVIVNVAAAHSEGVEVALEVLPFEGATFSSSAAWIQAVTDVAFDEDNPDGPVQPGTRLPGTPHFQWANVFAYEHALPYFDRWQGGLALTHVHIGSAPNDLRPVKEVGGYDTLDARISLVRPGTPWLPEIGLGMNNITDVRGLAAYTGDGDAVNFYYLLRPRTTLMTLAWTY